jgi:hypothetical protein
MAKAEYRTMAMKLPSQTNAANGRTRSTRASQRSGTLQLWEGPGLFRAGLFARPSYQKEQNRKVSSDLNQKMRCALLLMRRIFEINRLER